MYGSDKLTLLGPARWETDALGNQTPVEDRRTVFCRLRSASQREFFQAATMGLQAEYKAVVAAEEYHGETAALLRDRRYAIYRTYQDGPWMELYLGERGTQDGEHFAGQIGPGAG